MPAERSRLHGSLRRQKTFSLIWESRANLGVRLVAWAWFSAGGEKAHISRALSARGPLRQDPVAGNGGHGQTPAPHRRTGRNFAVFRITDSVSGTNRICFRGRLASRPVRDRGPEETPLAENLGPGGHPAAPRFSFGRLPGNGIRARTAFVGPRTRRAAEAPRLLRRLGSARPHRPEWARVGHRSRELPRGSRGTHDDPHLRESLSDNKLLPFLPRQCSHRLLAVRAGRPVPRRGTLLREEPFSAAGSGPSAPSRARAYSGWSHLPSGCPCRSLCFWNLKRLVRPRRPGTWWFRRILCSSSEFASSS